jgi:hypothetical protein
MRYLNLQISPKITLTVDHNDWNKETVRINNRIVSQKKVSAMKSNYSFEHLENGQMTRYTIIKKYDYLKGYLFDIFRNNEAMLQQSNEPRNRKKIAINVILFFAYVVSLMYCIFNRISPAIPLCFLPVYLTIKNKKNEKLIPANINKSEL